MAVVAAVARLEGDATPGPAAPLRAGMSAAAATLPGRVISQAAATLPRPITAALMGMVGALLDTPAMQAATDTRPVGVAATGEAGVAARGAVGAVAPGGAVTGAADFGRGRFTVRGSPGSCPFCLWRTRRTGIPAFLTTMPTTSTTPGIPRMTA